LKIGSEVKKTPSIGSKRKRVVEVEQGCGEDAELRHRQRHKVPNMKNNLIITFLFYFCTILEYFCIIFFLYNIGILIMFFISVKKKNLTKINYCYYYF